ncbi:hypothetical protein [Natronocalculus amylovorans]|uniref:Uncharacterized protein n=1 Tax=Natronocalculus amylovorans TaxID=2917812 RepID=A0AAE3G0G4_9EURY|nr:hypothetical protein [Natronocalculus amylovorans]MCL9818328.1 hypothetical protein [Natronocalculus amylovorans]
MGIPTSITGWIALFGVIVFIIIALYATTAWTIVVGGLLLILGGYIAYVVLYRVDRLLKHGSLR